MNDIAKDRQEFLAEVEKYPEAFRSRLSSSRRGFLRGTAAAGMAVGAAGVLGGCATKTLHSATAGGTNNGPLEGRLAVDKSATEKIVNFSNWVSYIDVDPNDKSKNPTLDKFKAETGITVKYTEDVNSNDDFFNKIHQLLAGGQDTGRDLMVLSDWMIGKLRQLGYLEQLNLANIPNWVNIVNDQRNPPYDPGRMHTMPWALGFTLMGVNKSAGGGDCTSIKAMMTDPKYKGKIGYFSEMEDGVGFALLAMGKNPLKFTDDDFKAAVAFVQKAKDSGQIRQFTGNDYLGDLQNGNFAVSMAYSGDLAQLGDDNIDWVIPDEGMLWFTDNMCIPAMARHKTNAEKLMNFYYDPANAAVLDDYISYIPSMDGAQDAMKAVDPAALTNTLIFPTDAMKAKAHTFMDLDLKTLEDYINQFNIVVSG